MYFPDLETKTDCPIIIIGFFASLMFFETTCLSSIISFIISVLPSKYSYGLARLPSFLSLNTYGVYNKGLWHPIVTLLNFESK